MSRYLSVPIPTLETPRLWLRPIQLSDAPRVQLLFPHPEVVRYLVATIPIPYPDDGAETYYRGLIPRIEAGEEYAWALVRKDDPEEGLIGVINLMPNSDRDHRGFWLGRPYWGKGYMAETVRAVNDFAFDELGMECLLLNNAEENFGSHRLKERSGAEIIGMEEVDFIAGRLPSVRWRLTREAWHRHRDEFVPAVDRASREG